MRGHSLRLPAYGTLGVGAGSIRLAGSMDTTSHDRGRPLAISRPSEPGSPVHPKRGLAPTILDVLRNSSMPALELKLRAAA